VVVCGIRDMEKVRATAAWREKGRPIQIAPLLQLGSRPSSQNGFLFRLRSLQPRTLPVIVESRLQWSGQKEQQEP